MPEVYLHRAHDKHWQFSVLLDALVISLELLLMSGILYFTGCQFTSIQWFYYSLLLEPVC